MNKPKSLTGFVWWVYFWFMNKPKLQPATKPDPRGGPRPNSGRPRSRVVLTFPPEVLWSLSVFAREEGVTVECKLEGMIEMYFGSAEALKSAKKLEEKQREESESAGKTVKQKKARVAGSFRKPTKTKK